MDATKKAMAKDDRERMGTRANDVYKQVTKKLMNKSKESTEMATVIDRLLNGYQIGANPKATV